MSQGLDLQLAVAGGGVERGVVGEHGHRLALHPAAHDDGGARRDEPLEEQPRVDRPAQLGHA